MPCLTMSRSIGVRGTSRKKPLKWTSRRCLIASSGFVMFMRAHWSAAHAMRLLPSRAALRARLKKLRSAAILASVPGSGSCLSGCDEMSGGKVSEFRQAMGVLCRPAHESSG